MAEKNVPALTKGYDTMTSVLEEVSKHAEQGSGTWALLSLFDAPEMPEIANDLRELACDLAEHVAPVFEARHPRDRRIRNALDLKRKSLTKPVPAADAERVISALTVGFPPAGEFPYPTYAREDIGAYFAVVGALVAVSEDDDPLARRVITVGLQAGHAAMQARVPLHFPYSHERCEFEIRWQAGCVARWLQRSRVRDALSRVEAPKRPSWRRRRERVLKPGQVRFEAAVMSDSRFETRVLQANHPTICFFHRGDERREALDSVFNLFSATLPLLIHLYGIRFAIADTALAPGTVFRECEGCPLPLFRLYRNGKCLLTVEIDRLLLPSGKRLPRKLTPSLLDFANRCAAAIENSLRGRATSPFPTSDMTGAAGARR